MIAPSRGQVDIDTAKTADQCSFKEVLTKRINTFGYANRHFYVLKITKDEMRAKRIEDEKSRCVAFNLLINISIFVYFQPLSLFRVPIRKEYNFQ